MKIIPPEILLEGYALGIFPMAPHKNSENIDWFTANRRGIIPLDQFRVSKNVHRLIRQHHFTESYDEAFLEVVSACADRDTTWISDVIIESYNQLSELGFAHSVEIRHAKKLVGGLYGVSLKGAFFGESMFHYEKEMDKIALYYCHKKLAEGGFKLWDTQFYTKHLSHFGCIEISDEDYQKMLKEAMKTEAHFHQ